jgi:hypothetical protein
MRAAFSQNRVVSGGVVTDAGGLNVDVSAAVTKFDDDTVNVTEQTDVSLTGSGGDDWAFNWVYANSSGTVLTSTSPPTGDIILFAVVDVDSDDILRIADLRALSITSDVTKASLGLDNVQNVDQTDAGNITSGTLDKDYIDNEIARLTDVPTVSDTAYDSGTWDGNTDAASKNAIRDKIVSMDASISGKEDALGNPTSDGMVLQSTTGGSRSWGTVSSGLGEMPSGVELTGNIVGGEYEINSTDATNDIDFGSIVCMDSTNTAVISSTSTITKQLDATWSAGDDSGGLLNGSKASSTIYHFYALLKDSDSSVDFGFLEDGDAIGTYLPSGYSKYRWIGFGRTNSSSAFCKFVMRDDEIFFLLASENQIATVGASYATADHTSMIPEDYITRIRYGGNDASGNTFISTSIDGTNTESILCRAGTANTDSHADAWGISSDKQFGYLPYDNGRQFKASNSPTLLLHGVFVGR